MVDVNLIPHPSSPHTQVTTLRVSAMRSPVGRLNLRYGCAGQLTQIRAEPFTQLRVADKLWEHTCFEAFLRVPGEATYVELNFSTSGAWAAYAFSGYREGMRPLPDVSPQIRVERGPSELLVDVTLNLLTLNERRSTLPLQLALSAVIEDVHGHRSFWAAHHAAPQPNFHHPDTFVVELN
jgi:hypothetical protein